MKSSVPRNVCFVAAGMALAADVIVTVGCGDARPVYPGKRYSDWELDDPSGKTLEEVRPIRDELETRVRASEKSYPGLSSADRYSRVIDQH